MGVSVCIHPYGVLAQLVASDRKSYASSCTSCVDLHCVMVNSAVVSDLSMRFQPLLVQCVHIFFWAYEYNMSGYLSLFIYVCHK